MVSKIQNSKESLLQLIKRKAASVEKVQMEKEKRCPGILSQILDTCFCSSLTDNKQWHSTYTPANASYDQRLDAPFCSSHQARGLHKTHDSPVGRVTLASEQERGAKGVVLCPPLDKGREADMARSQG